MLFVDCSICRVLSLKMKNKHQKLGCLQTKPDQQEYITKEIYFSSQGSKPSVTIHLKITHPFWLVAGGMSSNEIREIPGIKDKKSLEIAAEASNQSAAGYIVSKVLQGEEG